MWRHLKVNLTDLVFSASEAMDLSDPSLVDHQMRTAYVCNELARGAKIHHESNERLFLAALMHDIGALSPEDKIGIHNYEDVLPEPHCQRGAKLFADVAWLEAAADIVAWHHTPMAAHIKAGRSISDPMVLSAQILMLADQLERAINRKQFILHQLDRLKNRIRNLSGHGLHPDVIALFDRASSCESFWLELVAQDLSLRIKERNPLRSIELDYEGVRSIARVFKDITDFRSRFTATHSAGVASCATGIAQKLNFTGKDLQQIEIAGLLHDIGKLVVPNAILCKPEKLTPDEYAVVRQHAFYTHRILSRVRGLEQIAEWAASHHERLDGSGYSENLNRAEIDLGAKIIAVADVATAIAEDRPYRGPGDEEKVLKELWGMADRGKLEVSVVGTLAEHYEEIMTKVHLTQLQDKERYTQRYAAIG